MIDEKNTGETPNNEEIQENEIQNTEPIDSQNDVDSNEITLLSDEPENDTAPASCEADGIEDTDNAAADTADNGADTAEEAVDEEANDEENTDDTENGAEGADNEEKLSKVHSIFDFVELFIFTLAAVLIITSFFVRYSVVEGDSMVDTLHDGDTLLISDFLYDPEYGDIIVVHSDVLDKVIVKRVIATEGQTVRITPKAIYVDGKELTEDYVYTADFTGWVGYQYDVPAEGFIETVVPDGEVFVMGDHRNLSEDSRSIGTISEEAIIGKVILRLAPFNEFGSVD